MKKKANNRDEQKICANQLYRIEYNRDRNVMKPLG